MSVGHMTETLEQRPPALVRTKLHPPPRRAQTVVRDRLLERLRPQPEVKLTLVAAPAGCGKTTLLAMWRDAEATRRPVAWLTLDERDNDPAVLWSHVLEALRAVCPGISLSPSPRTVGAALILDVLLPRLVNALAEQGDVAVILDDFHRLSSGASRDSVAWLVEHVPSTCQVIVASRREPAFGVASLRAHGELLELRADELAFTSDEADALLNGHLELGVPRGDIDRLVERTEGWPAGLYLVGLSLGGLEDREAFVRAFGGTNRHVVDFLADEVLDAHDPGTRTLMLRSSVLKRFCGPLCDALLDEEGNSERLRELSRTNLFLVPLDDHGEWYRFHHLFAQLLRVELEHREPGLAPMLHRRAFAWHRDNGSTEESIEHALEAGAFAEATELIAATWMLYVNVCRYTTVLAWLERVPRELRREDPQLLLVEAWVLSLCARREEAANAIAAVERLGGLDAGPLPDGFSSIEASLATLRGAIPWGDIGGALEHAGRAAELEGPESYWRPVVCSALGEALFFSGDFDEADRWLAEATEVAPLHAHWINAATAHAYRSRIAGEQGRVDEQTLLAGQALQLVHEHDLDGMDGEAFVAFGTSLERRGRLEEALPFLERGAAVLRSRGLPRDLADALICQAAVLRAMDRSDDAGEVIREARAVIDSCPDPRALAERLAVLERPRRTRRRVDGEALSERELVVLRMLGGPLSERDIGRELYLSHNTIHSHTRSIYRKLGVSSRAEAVRRATSLGLPLARST
jgi:ATP/maltotriose-dependent transcriptional regulator MalT